MNSELLVKFGLTKNESLIYLTLIKLKESKVGAIIKESSFKSGKIYEFLDSLVKKGLISFITKNNVKYFYANSPKKVLDYIKLKKDNLDEQEKEFRNILPDLDRYYQKKVNSCDVKVYEGIEGIRTALLFLLEKMPKDSEILTFGANDNSNRDIILSWSKYEEICKKNNIKSKFIMSSWTNEDIKRRKKVKNSLKEFRYLKGEDISNFTIGKDIILIFNFEIKNCISIENQTHSTQFRRLFELLWKLAKP